MILILGIVLIGALTMMVALSGTQQAEKIRVRVEERRRDRMH